MENTELMTYLEFLDRYIVRCRAFVSPGIFREASKRGLVYFLNQLSEPGCQRPVRFLETMK